MELDTIICGDNVQVLRTFPDNCIDLTVTSPPYDNLRTYHGHTWDFEGVAQELYRVTKPGGVAVWVVADATINGSETGTSFRQALRFMEIGFKLHDTMIYHKVNPLPRQRNRYEQAFEYMFVLSKGVPATVNLMRVPAKYAGRVAKHTARDNNQDALIAGIRETRETRILLNVWSYTVGGSMADKEAFKHPAIFPEALARDHILSWSNPGDVVLDPFCGSGTTCKMAKLLGRHYIGIDISPEYCGLARQRVALATVD